MSEVAVKTVFWPDLSRFGAKLTVAFSPSLERNFLKFTVVDKKLFSTASGNSGVDLHQVMRDAGYAYAPSEIKARYAFAYDAAQRLGLQSDQIEEIAGAELSTLPFYSSSMLVKRELIKQIVPAVTEADFRDLPVSDIKHFDFEYLDKGRLRVLVEQQQAIRGAMPGVFFTTPADRALVVASLPSPVRINELLSFRDFPPGDVVKRKSLTPAAAEIAKFNVVPAIEKLMVGQSLGLDGTPLKAAGLGATVIGYPTFEGAVAANGGDVENIERVQLPYSVPLGFTQDSQRLLVLKDVRFLEVPNLLRLQERNDVAHNVQMHWDYSAKAHQLLAQYDLIKAEGLLAMAAWDDPETFVKVTSRFVEIMETMHEASRLTGKYSDFVEHIDLAVHLGLRASAFEPLFPKEFFNFLGQFRTHLYEAMSQKRSVVVTDQVVRESTSAAIAAVKVAEDAAVKSTEKVAAKAVVKADGGVASSRREDAGDKIGGARKDYASRSLHADEIESLTQRELMELVTKDNVWKSLDYQAMRDDGVMPEIAYIIKDLRSGLPVNPLRGGFNASNAAMARRANNDLTAEMSENFVLSVTIVRDALVGVRSHSDLERALVKIHRNANLPYVTKYDGVRRAVNTDGDSFFQDGAGWKFCSRSLPGFALSNPNFNETGVGFESGRLVSLLAFAKAKTQGGWDWCIRAKSRKEDAVVADDSDVAAKVVIAKVEKPQPVFRHLESVTRSGNDVRGGKDVDEAMLLNAFGFRGVEYGNWLPQAERQVVLNHAFDAFADLAKALGLPLKAMSLGGELSIAFGARGTGGKGAASAHYEGARNVINLTRLAGAGFLAHEWGHAFDYWLSKTAGVSATRPVSEMVSVPSERLNIVVNALTVALNTARSRLMTKEEVIARSLKVDDKNQIDLEKHFEKCVLNWIAHCDFLLPEDKRNGVFKAYAVEQLFERIVPASDAADCVTKRFVGVEDFTRLVVDALKTQIGPEFDIKQVNRAYPQTCGTWLNRRMSSVETIIAKYSPQRHPTRSHFLQDAEHYDGFRSKAYWSTRVETFARAFETWVQERIEADGTSRSQYLVYGREDDPSVAYSIFPRGEERALNAAKFVALFEGHRPALVRYLGLEAPAAAAGISHENSASIPG